MKYLILIFPLILIACSLSGVMWNYDCDDNLIINDEIDIMNVCKGIEYRTDFAVWGVGEYWQTPGETLELMTGDCEDVAILYMYLAHKYLKVDYYFMGIRSEGGDHALLSRENIIIDPTFKYLINLYSIYCDAEIVEYLDYGETMYQAVYVR